MTRRNTTNDLDPRGDAAYDDDYTGRSARDYLGLIVASAAIIGGCVIVAILAWTAADYFLGDKAGAVTRPDPYAGLDVSQMPDVTHIEFDGNGHARVAGTNPDTAGPWLVAAFHVPNPDNWHDGQGDPTDTDTLPPGPFDLTLNCPPGAAQVDVWLEGQDQPYASDTSAEHGWDTCAPPADITPDSFPVSTPGTDATVPDAQVPPPALTVASSEEAQPTLPPAVASPAASTNVAILTSRAELPATGTSSAPLLAALAAALMLVGAGCCSLTRKGLRS